jgi:hypothetical protein
MAGSNSGQMRGPPTSPRDWFDDAEAGGRTHVGGGSPQRCGLTAVEVNDRVVVGLAAAGSYVRKVARQLTLLQTPVGVSIMPAYQPPGGSLVAAVCRRITLAPRTDESREANPTPIRSA